MASTPLPIIASGSGGATVGTTPMQLTASTSKRYQRIVNNGSGVLWCTRDPLATPSVAGAGCFSIAAGQSEEYPIPGSPYVPIAATWAVSDSSCTVAVEVN